jgi:hypothetical protein
MSSSNSADLRWQALLKDFPRSGLTHLEFCRLRGISLHTFRKKLYGQKAVAPAIPRDGAALPAARFLPVAIPAAPVDSARPADPLVLVLAGGRRLAVAEGFDPETLHRLIDALERRP